MERLFRKTPRSLNYLDTMLWVAETHLRLLYIDCQPYKMKFSLQQDQCQRYTLSKFVQRFDETPASKLAVSYTGKFYIEKK
jgi:hypothetical protein